MGRVLQGQKFMGPSRLGQFWGAKLKNHWYTDIGWDFCLAFMI